MCCCKCVRTGESESVFMRRTTTIDLCCVLMFFATARLVQWPSNFRTPGPRIIKVKQSLFTEITSSRRLWSCLNVLDKNFFFVLSVVCFIVITSLKNLSFKNSQQLLQFLCDLRLNFSAKFYCCWTCFIFWLLKWLAILISAWND